MSKLLRLAMLGLVCTALCVSMGCKKNEEDESYTEETTTEMATTEPMGTEMGTSEPMGTDMGTSQPAGTDMSSAPTPSPAQ
jgi:hypothetical protein